MKLFRLIKDGKVVGYEKAMYVDALQSLYWRQSEKGINWHVPLDYTIPHDRKDQYTGIEVNGEKVFEGDVRYLAGYGEYVVEFPFIQLHESAAEGDVGHLIRIQGVTNEN